MNSKSAAGRLSQEELYFFEAERISLYLIAELPREQEKVLYADAIQKLDIALSPVERRLWSRMLESRFIMALADAGLALAKPDSPLRRRIYTLLAILEASPAYTRYFLAESAATFLGAALAGARAVCGQPRSVATLAPRTAVGIGRNCLFRG